MLGHRGCRLGITYPEIYEMQGRAILEAAAEIESETGNALDVEIMVPLIATVAEFRILKDLIDRVAEEVTQHTNLQPRYVAGTMIELPREALRAGEIAEFAEFFSFGTNDLTQTTLGLSRDDSASFLRVYGEQGILEKDPFVSIDEAGVGE